MIKSSKNIVYAFPHAGAGTGVYNDWVKQSRSDKNIIIVPVSIPGRDKLSRENIIDDLFSLADRIATDIYTDFMQRIKNGSFNFVTFGHSFGGVLSFIVTQQISLNFNLTPSLSIISGSIPPSIQQEDDRHLWTDKEILFKMRTDKGTPECILNEPAIARRLVTSLRTDYILRHQFLAYRNSKVQQPLSIIAADKDEHVSKDMLLAWQVHCSLPIKITEIKGGHFSIYENYCTVLSLLNKNELACE